MVTAVQMGPPAVAALGPTSGPDASSLERDMAALVDRLEDAHRADPAPELAQAVLRAREALHWLWERTAQQLAKAQQR